MNSSSLFDSRATRRRFDAAAATFDGADFVHAATRDGLMARLEPMVVDAGLVLDLGAATGAALKPLRQRFPKADVVAIDQSLPMLEKCRRRQRWPRRPLAVQADAAALPFADGSVDVVFSNLLLPLIGDPATMAAEVARVLRKGGLFAFSSLGPDSLAELRRAWAAIDEAGHVLEFPDMHDLGDALVRAGLSDPVLDVDRLEVTYATPARLFADLTAAGARNSLAHRPAGLTGRETFRRLENALLADGEIRLELELVYGHAWGSGARRGDGAVRIDAGDIPVRRRNS